MLSENKTQAMPEQAPLEKRKNARSGLAMENQETQFMLMRGDEPLAISKVRDVSISGVGVEARHEFKEGEAVALAYDSGDFQLSIQGTVMWCKPEGGGEYAMGIEFDTSNRQDNALFFLAIRKYLDEFDGTYIDA